VRASHRGENGTIEGAEGKVLGKRGGLRERDWLGYALAQRGSQSVRGTREEHEKTIKKESSFHGVKNKRSQGAKNSKTSFTDREIRRKTTEDKRDSVEKKRMSGGWHGTGEEGGVWYCELGKGGGGEERRVTLPNLGSTVEGHHKVTIATRKRTIKLQRRELKQKGKD